jgi:hypothetical protein
LWIINAEEKEDTVEIVTPWKYPKESERIPRRERIRNDVIRRETMQNKQYWKQ